jgi:hypothetical protein
LLRAVVFVILIHKHYLIKKVIRIARKIVKYMPLN